jgi:glycosyltransferase involved in cell wall biosynthesis
MRILVSAITYYPTVGGADDFARSIAEGVAARGHQVAVVTSDLEQHVSGKRLVETRSMELNGVRIVRCRSVNLPGHVYPVWPGFFRRVREFRPDLIHAFGLGYWSVDAPALTGRLPVLVSPTGGRYRTGRLYDLMRTTLLKRVESAPLWTALSESERGALRRDHPSARSIRILSPSIVPADWETIRPDPFPDVPREGRILYAGRLSKDKGIDDLLEAFRAARARRPAALAIVGPDYGYGRPTEEEGVHFAGTLDREALLAAYQNSELLVLPSFHEGFGIVLLEAMAAGKPVVAYANTSMPELCRDGVNGIAVPTGDRTALGEALAGLLGDAALRIRMGEAGRRIALEEYSRERMLDTVIALYRETLGAY